MVLVFHIVREAELEKEKEGGKKKQRGDIAVVLQISSNYALKCAGSQ